MRAFLHLVRLSIRQQLTYRAAILGGLATNFFFALMRVSVLLALYGDAPEINGLTRSGAITFVAVSQAMIAFLFMFGTWDVMGTIYNGSVGSDLLKPMSLISYWMARDLGRSLVNFVLRGLLLMGLYALLYPIQLPATPEQRLALPVAVGLSWLVSFAWRFLVNLSALWTPDARGVGRVAFMVASLLAGFYMPMRLYPDWFVRLCYLTPFPALYNISVEVYLGLISGPELVKALISQAFWVVALFFLAWLALQAGIRRLVIQGG